MTGDSASSDTANPREGSGRSVILYICAECGAEHFVGGNGMFDHFLSEIRCGECDHVIKEELEA